MGIKMAIGGLVGWIKSKLESGDVDPTKFDINQDFTPEQLDNMLKTNTVVKIATLYKSDQTFKEGYTFDDDSINRVHDRFGNQYHYTSFKEFVDWQGIDEELKLADTWRLLFGQSLVVLFKGSSDDGIDDEYYSDIRTYSPMVNGIGYEIIGVDSKGVPNKFRVTTPVFNDIINSVKEVVYSGDRCVLFTARRLSESITGDSALQDIIRLARAYEILINAVAQLGAKMAAGTIVFSSPKAIKEGYIQELKKIDSGNINRLSHLILPDAIQVDWLTPAIEGDIEKLIKIMNQQIAMALRISITHLTGEKAGALASATENRIHTFETIRQNQKELKKHMQKVFYLLGNSSGAFTWNEPEKPMKETNSDTNTPEPKKIDVESSTVAPQPSVDPNEKSD